MTAVTRAATGVNAGDPTRPTIADLLGIQLPDWYLSGLCAQTDPERFFPEKGGSTREAKRLCNGDPARGIEPCPVRAECLEFALEHDERHGIWGGVSERDRRTLRQAWLRKNLGGAA